MYRRATTGLEDNNNKFSNCSLETMGPVVIAIKNQLVGKTNCLTGSFVFLMREEKKRSMFLKNVHKSDTVAIEMSKIMKNAIAVSVPNVRIIVVIQPEVQIQI